MELLRTGKFSNEIATVDEFACIVSDIMSVINKYGWQDEIVHPYSFDITIKDFVRNWSDYPKCTFMSKQVLIAEVNGFIPILKEWIKTEEEPKVLVSIKGETKEIPESWVQSFLMLGAEVLNKEGRN